MECRKFFTFSFDDGLEQDKRIIHILKEYGMQATFNLNPGLFGVKQKIGRIGNLGILNMPDESKVKARIFQASNHHRIPEDEIAQVYRGFEVASHGFRHELLSRLDGGGQDESIRLGIKKLNQIVGYPIVGHAYAGGAVNGAAASCLSKYGIIYGRDAKCSHTFAFPDNPLLYKPTSWMIQQNLFAKADEFLTAETIDDDLLFCVWGHGYEFDFGTKESNWDRLKRLCEKMVGKKDICYSSNKEAFLAHRRK